MKTFLLSVLFVFNLMVAQHNTSKDIIIKISEKGFSFGEKKIIDEDLKSFFRDYEININTINRVFKNKTKENRIKNIRNREVTMPSLDLIYIVKLKNKYEIDDFIRESKEIDCIIYIEADIGSIMSVNSSRLNKVVSQKKILKSNDSEYSKQWYLSNTGQSGGTSGIDINIEDAWLITTGNNNVKVGIVDNGVLPTHEEFSSRISGYYNYNAQDHGTYIAGIIGAEHGNFNIKGINPNVNLVSGELSSTSISITSSSIINLVDDDVNVINLSFSLEYLNGLPSYSNLMHETVVYAHINGVTIVASSGKTGTNDSYYPASHKSVISIGGIDNNGLIGNYSNYNSSLDFVAPGGSGSNGADDIYSTAEQTNDDYNYTFGTSFSAPMVTGVISLLESINPDLQPEDHFQLLKMSATKLAGMGGQDRTNEYGYGLINAHAAVTLLTGNKTIKHLVFTGGTTHNTVNEFSKFFEGVDGVGVGVHTGTMKVIRRTVSLPSYISNKIVWGTGSLGKGYLNDGNIVDGAYNTKIISTTASSATLETTVYEVFTTGGTRLGWFPASPSNAKFAISVYGDDPPMQVSISGPSSLAFKSTGNWSANVSENNASVTYLWERKYSFQSSWTSVSTSSNYSLMMGTYSFDLRLTVDDGNEIKQTTKFVEFSELRAKVNGNDNIPKEYSLNQNYPNPFNPKTNIKFGLPENSFVNITIYNISGKKILKLVNEKLNAGYHTYAFNADKFPSGIYFAKISTEKFTKSIKMNLIK